MSADSKILLRRIVRNFSMRRWHKNKLQYLGSLLATFVGGVLSLALASSAAADTPFYEPAFYNGTTVTINAIEVEQNPTQQAQADFFEVVYPIGWESLDIGIPQCNPCDHVGNGIDFTDFHDHVLDSIPSSPGHGEFSPLWRVFVVLPAYTGNTAHDARVTKAYAAQLPATSEAAVEDLAASTLRDGSPVAVMIDTHFYFLCSVVDDHAAP